MRVAFVATAVAMSGACASGADVQPMFSTGGPASEGGSSNGDDDDDASTESSTGEPAAESSSSSGEPDTASSDESTTGGALPPPEWLLTVAESAGMARLLHHDLTTGISQPICNLPVAQGYDSLAITRDGQIYAHATVLDMVQRIDPCTCLLQDVLPSAGPMQLSAGEGDDLLGLRTATGDVVTIDVAFGTMATIGTVGDAFMQAGIAWSDEIDATYLVDTTNDQLYFYEPGGVVSLITDLAVDLGPIGLDVHQGNGSLYVCTQDDVLGSIDTFLGAVTPFGPLGSMGPCDDLAAPFGPVDCIE